MTAQRAGLTDTLSVFPFPVRSELLLDESLQALSAAEAMREMPARQLRSFLVAPPGDSSEEVDPSGTCTWRAPSKDMLPQFRPRRAVQSIDRFMALQKWEGVVVDVQPEAFLARVSDLTHQNMDEEAELPIAEVSEADRALVREGAVFYWTIGYLDDRYGQRQRASRIRFRRLPAWTDEEIDSARREADALAQQLGWK